MTKVPPRGAVRPRAGQIIILYGLMFPVLLGFTGLAVDVGLTLVAQRHYQKIAAVCAIVAAQVRAADTAPYSAVRTRGERCVAVANGIADSGNSIQVNVPPSRGPYSANDSFVEVLIDVPRPTLFIRMFGIDSLPAQGRAVAGIRTTADFAVQGLRGGTDSVECNGCSSTTIVGNACARGQFDSDGNNLMIVGQAAANQGFEPPAPSSTGGNLSPGPPCLDPGYPLPTSLPGLPPDLSALTSATLTITTNPGSPDEVPCPPVHPYPLYDVSRYPHATVVVKDCPLDPTPVRIAAPRVAVTVLSGNHANVELVGSQSDPQTGVFKRVLAQGTSTLFLVPGYYDSIDVNAQEHARFKNGLYLISTGFDGSNGSVANVPNPLDSNQQGVSLVVGLRFKVAGSATVNLQCCASQMQNRVLIYHLGGCLPPYAGIPPSPFPDWANRATFPSPPWPAWTCAPTTEMPNQILLGGSSQNTFGSATSPGTIYSPYQCNQTTFPTSCPPALPQFDCTGGTAGSGCIRVGGGGGTRFYGQVIAPDIRFDGSGPTVTYPGGGTTGPGEPFLAE